MSQALSGKGYSQQGAGRREDQVGAEAAAHAARAHAPVVEGLQLGVVALLVRGRRSAVRRALLRARALPELRHLPGKKLKPYQNPKALVPQCQAWHMMLRALLPLLQGNADVSSEHPIFCRACVHACMRVGGVRWVRGGQARLAQRLRERELRVLRADDVAQRAAEEVERRAVRLGHRARARARACLRQQYPKGVQAAAVGRGSTAPFAPPPAVRARATKLSCPQTLLGDKCCAECLLGCVKGLCGAGMGKRGETVAVSPSGPRRWQPTCPAACWRPWRSRPAAPAWQANSCFASRCTNFHACMPDVQGMAAGKHLPKHELAR